MTAARLDDKLARLRAAWVLTKGDSATENVAAAAIAASTSPVQPAVLSGKVS